MALNAAHYTATLDAKPSIFDVVAQQSLNDVLHPAFRKFISFLATSNPGQFGWLHAYYDEVFVLCDTLLQVHYLKTNDSGFAESFYGLRRVPRAPGALKDLDRILSLVFLVVGPYVKRKLDEHVRRYQFERAEGTVSIYKRMLITGHAIYTIAFHTLTFVQYIRYMTNATGSPTVPLALLKLQLVYKATPSLWPVLEFLAFFMQFLQTWNEQQTTFKLGALPLVPPPSLDNKAVNYRKLCPVCLQTWKIPTVLPVSGYVFCFTCIVKWLQGQRRCPVTGLPARPLDLVRLYDLQL